MTVFYIDHQSLTNRLKQKFDKKLSDDRLQWNGSIN